MPNALRDTPDAAVEMIKSFEGIPDGDASTVNIDAYLDPIGIWTIGWGHAIPFKGDFLRGAANKASARSLYPGGITKAQAEALLRGDLVDTTAAVLRLVKVDVDDAQLSALISFAFNLGAGALGKSTLLRLLNSGDFSAAAQQFLVWDKARVNGELKALPGLTRRRRAERALFLGEDWQATPTVRGRLRGALTTTAKMTQTSNGAAELPSKVPSKVPTKTPAKPRARTTTKTSPLPPAPAKRRPLQTAR